MAALQGLRSLYLVLCMGAEDGRGPSPVPLSAPRPFLSRLASDGSTDSERETPQPVDTPIARSWEAGFERETPQGHSHGPLGDEGGRFPVCLQRGRHLELELRALPGTERNGTFFALAPQCPAAGTLTALFVVVARGRARATRTEGRARSSKRQRPAGSRPHPRTSRGSRR